MCAHFESPHDKALLKKHFGVDLPSELARRDVWPGYMSIFIRRHPHADEGDEAVPLREALIGSFGLIPHWSKDDKIARHTYNARSETAAEKPSYRTAWRHRQYGLVLVDNFYEPSYESGRAVRWKIELASREPFGIACLWDRWTNPASGEHVVSFSMLTVNADAHPVMRQFHQPADEKRTPVILPPPLFDAWLSADTEQASELMTWATMPELRAMPSPRK